MQLQKFIESYWCIVKLDNTLQFEIKQYLERIYGLEVSQVRTLNVEGKKKRNKFGFFRRPDYKKAHVTFKRPAEQSTATA